MKVFRSKGAPIKAWIDGVELEDAAKAQLLNVSELPFIHRHVAVMPDVHWGMGATVGSVIATKGAIVPAAVGVDIGCGMIAQATSLTSDDFGDGDLARVRAAIESAVPHGRTDNGGPNDRGRWSGPPPESDAAWRGPLGTGWISLAADHSKLERNAHPLLHLGTLGTGNHFIEVCCDETDHVWVMLHSGSRGPGSRIGQYFIQKAKEECDRYFVDLPDPNLAYFPEGTPGFDEYRAAVLWAQDYARVNREVMLERTIRALRTVVSKPFEVGPSAVNCHHNYVARENHFGENVWITRKGAVRAREGDLGIIPGSMGARSYIVRGLGNPESFHSCSHGAGRRMSRTAAKKAFTLQDHVEATAGVECRKDADVIDETPGAYKPIEDVMAAQKDLVQVEHTLKQIVCVKG